MGTQQPVMITGRGIVSPLGVGVEHNFQQLCMGELATGPSADLCSLRAGQHMGVVVHSDLTVFTSQRGLRRFDRAVALAVQCVIEALDEANLMPKPDRRIPNHRIALCLATSSGPAASVVGAIGAFETGGEAYLKRKHPLGAVHAAQASIAGEIARRFHINGPSMTINAECASGNTVVAIGQQLITAQAADAVVCCSVDAPVIDFLIAQANLIGALASGRCRPFDLNRDGFVLSEGAAAVVLESVLESPSVGTSKPADTLHGVRLLSVGMSTDTSHPTAPAEDGDALSRAILSALKQAQLRSRDIDVVSAHGTGTPRNDSTELLALERVLGKGIASTPVHSIKSMIGHTLAAAGLIELVILSRTLESGVIPPIVGCRTPLSTQADLVLGTSRVASMAVGLSTSCGFGGNNTAALLSLPPQAAAGSVSTEKAVV